MTLLLLVLSPLAGFLADVKFSRFKVFICSTYFMIVTNAITVMSATLTLLTVHEINYYLYGLISISVVSILVYISSSVFFLLNLIQFGTDQLSDAPTQYSILFLIVYYWCDQLSDSITLSTSLPQREFDFDISHKIIKVDKLRGILLLTILLVSTLVTIVILLLICKNKNLLMTENIKDNSYKLVYNIVSFTLQNKRPLRRSSFTYCEHVYPSRLDFAKQKRLLRLLCKFEVSHIYPNNG